MAMLDDYHQALGRLVSNSPTRISQPYTINNDSVSLEAGRGRGSIKKSRPEFKPLIEAIKDAALKYRSGTARKIEHHGAINYKTLYEAALEREISLILENIELRQALSKAGLAPESSAE